MSLLVLGTCLILGLSLVRRRCLQKGRSRFFPNVQRRRKKTRQWPPNQSQSQHLESRQKNKMESSLSLRYKRNLRKRVGGMHTSCVELMISVIYDEKPPVAPKTGTRVLSLGHALQVPSLGLVQQQQEKCKLTMWIRYFLFGFYLDIIYNLTPTGASDPGDPQPHHPCPNRPI
jgi:hypothetical protein